MTHGLRVIVAAICFTLPAAGASRAQEEAPPRVRSARPPAAARPTASSEDRAFLHQLGEAQRALGEQLQQLKERLEALHSEIGERQEESNGTEQEVKALREEVKGLYVELSGVKQQIDSVRDDIQGVNSNVSAFRTFSGFFIAAMVLLLAVIFVMTIRR